MVIWRFGAKSLSFRRKGKGPQRSHWRVLVWICLESGRYQLSVIGMRIEIMADRIIGEKRLQDIIDFVAFGRIS
jgi:hypothetical protein